jgi:hypothetical protein
MSGGGGSSVLAARDAMRISYRRESRWAARVDRAVEPDTQAGSVTPEGALLTAQLRRIVRARIAAHIASAPELRPAVEVLLYEEAPRTVAARVSLPVTDIYAASQRLRARLRADHELQRLWLDQAA